MLNVINVNNKESLTDEAYHSSHEIHPYCTILNLLTDKFRILPYIFLLIYIATEYAYAEYTRSCVISRMHFEKVYFDLFYILILRFYYIFEYYVNIVLTVNDKNFRDYMQNVFVSIVIFYYKKI